MVIATSMNGSSVCQPQHLKPNTNALMVSTPFTHDSQSLQYHLTALSHPEYAPASGIAIRTNLSSPTSRSIHSAQLLLFRQLQSQT